MNYNDTKKMKNLIRVAMEIAGKGESSGTNTKDEIEAITHTENEVDTKDVQAENVVMEIVEKLIYVQKSLGHEMTEEEIDLALNTIFNKD
mgnify:CR=1 FL=1